MMRHRASSQPDNNNGEESSDDDDAFTALSRKRRGDAKTKDLTSKNSTAGDRTESDAPTTGKTDMPIDSKPLRQQPVVVAQTSSTKRHHGEASDARKAKLDAILLELEADTSKISSDTAPHKRHRRNNNNISNHHRNVIDSEHHSRIGGSFVDPGDELITTNIFVGNLAPSITEEQMTELFRQFGDLYSVKIMWPRTPEERVRNRHTGFVCFMNRQDAEDAMDACNEQDPFRVGRQLMLRWGKNVRKSDGGVPITYRGTGGLVSPHIENNDVAAAALRAELHPTSERNAIHVIVPRNRDRANLISTVASFVAKDGTQFEQMLLQHEAQNAHLNFLSITAADIANSNVAKEELIFFKWRVYAFCQGDGFSTWRTDPFTMIQPNGCIWYPPPLDLDAAQREADEVKRKEDVIRALKDERRHQNTKRNILTGRQLEQQRKKGQDGTSTELSESEIDEFERLFKQDLCMSRESICQAMAFCFEKSNAAKQISLMVQDLLMKLAPGISIETLSARVYLISDILYNSQQPGIRNAFLYRDAIERMSPDLFSFLGDFLRANFGRLSQERFTSAVVTQVFSAWSKWGVFDPTYIDDLSARFEGRTVLHCEHDTEAVQEKQESVVRAELPVAEKIAESPVEKEKPKGDWTSIAVLHESFKDAEQKNPSQSRTDNFAVNEDDDSDADGEPLDEELDGTPLKTEEEDPKHEIDDDSIDGEPCDDDVDGVPL